jgi:hypothetical protein
MVLRARKDAAHAIHELVLPVLSDRLTPGGPPEDGATVIFGTYDALDAILFTSGSTPEPSSEPIHAAVD